LSEGSSTTKSYFIHLVKNEAIVALKPSIEEGEIKLLSCSIVIGSSLTNNQVPFHTLLLDGCKILGDFRASSHSSIVSSYFSSKLYNFKFSKISNFNLEIYNL